jgi:hypothetical protein
MYTFDQTETKSFRRARRRAFLERIRALLTGRSADLLCYGRLKDFVEVTGTERIGYLEIPTEAIVGSVERCSDYSHSFSPLKDSDQGRWTRVREAINSGAGLPPINVYQVGEAFFVVDGHHRVSVARQLGWTHIAAQVVEICTRTPFDPYLLHGEAG